MRIEQPETFITWLVDALKPLCDADPATLAKYLLEVIKKVKSEKELHKIIAGQLEFFLEKETESFVSLMLRTLETQDYMTTPVTPNRNPPNPILVKSTNDSKPIVHPSEVPNLNETVNGSNAARKEHESKRDREMQKTPITKNDAITQRICYKKRRKMFTFRTTSIKNKILKGKNIELNIINRVRKRKRTIESTSSTAKRPMNSAKCVPRQPTPYLEKIREYSLFTTRSFVKNAGDMQKRQSKYKHLLKEGDKNCEVLVLTDTDSESELTIVSAAENGSAVAPQRELDTARSSEKLEETKISNKPIDKTVKESILQNAQSSSLIEKDNTNTRKSTDQAESVKGNASGGDDIICISDDEDDKVGAKIPEEMNKQN